MFFDDRLATVLRQRITGEAGRRTQFRQLLDLLGNARSGGLDQSLMAAAWLRMEALAAEIPAAERAAIVSEAGWRFRSPDLAAHLAEQEPEVAATALLRLDLQPDDWAELIPRLPIRARGFLRLRRDLPLDVEALLERLGVHDRGLPRPQDKRDDAPTAAPARDHPGAASQSTAPRPRHPEVREAGSPIPFPPPGVAARDPDATGRSEISALVERIAQFRRERTENPPESDRSPRLPLGESVAPVERHVTGFAFAADASGRIEWANGEVAPMVIGARLVPLSGRSGELEDNPLDRAISRRQPIVRAPASLDGAPAIAGDWIVDAQPRFSEAGHFTGYVGRFRRAPSAHKFGPSPEAQEADRIRQLLHELRTPVTAVQGYAEVIQQQLFGPAPHEYRALAAAIASDAAHILAGFDELDRLARLETGALVTSPGEADLADLIRRSVARLAPVLGSQMAAIELDLAPATSLFVAIDEDDAEGLLWRVLATLGGSCGEGESITFSLRPVIGRATALARLCCDLPERLRAADDIFAVEAQSTGGAINAGVFGTGFALRLARAEARAAGGELLREDGRLELTLPLLETHDEANRIEASSG